MALTRSLTLASLVSLFALPLAAPPPPTAAVLATNAVNMDLPTILPTLPVTGVTTVPPPPWSILSTTGPMTSFSSGETLDTTVITSEPVVLTSEPVVTSSEPVTSVIPTPSSLVVSSSSSAWSQGAATSSELTITSTTVPSLTMSHAPASTSTLTSKHEVESPVRRIVTIVVPTIVGLLLLLFALGYCLMRRRKEKKRVDKLARKADWFDQEYIDNIKKQFGCLDQSKVGVLGASSPSNAVDEGVINVRKTRILDSPDTQPTGKPIIRTPSQARKRYGTWMNPLGMHPVEPSGCSATELVEAAAEYELSSLSTRSSTGTVVVSRAKESASEPREEAEEEGADEVEVDQDL